MTQPSLKITLIILLAAALAWAGVFFCLQLIHGKQADVEQAIRDSKQADTSEEGRAQIASTLTSTESGRAEVTRLLTIDLLTLAGEVKKVGQDAGVELRVSSAAPEAVPGQKGKDSKAFTISAVNFTIEGEGTFDALYHALTLLETVSIPARVEDVSFIQNDDDTVTPWNMKVRLRILTALPLSS